MDCEYFEIGYRAAIGRAITSKQKKSTESAHYARDCFSKASDDRSSLSSRYTRLIRN